jgi:hypothetical protein
MRLRKGTHLGVPFRSQWEASAVFSYDNCHGFECIQSRDYGKAPVLK